MAEVAFEVREKTDQQVFDAAHRTALALLRSAGVKYERFPEVEGGLLVLANHTSMFDGIIMYAASRRPLYLLCLEDLVRNGQLPHWNEILNPVLVTQGNGLTLSAVRDVMALLRDGRVVVVFPEGVRTVDGVTGPVSPTWASVAKKTGATLLTYRLTGGYLQHPMWAVNARRGCVQGNVAGVYPPEQLQSEDIHCIERLVEADLQVDQMALQRLQMNRYAGPRRAEGLENVLTICPKCGAYDSFQPHGHHLMCQSCGLDCEYDEFGFLVGRDVPFETLAPWRQWMSARFDEDYAMRKQAGDESFQLSYPHVELQTIDLKTHEARICAAGVLTADERGMQVGAVRIEYTDISDMALQYKLTTMLFTAKGVYYNLTGSRFSAWMVQRLFELNRSL